MRSACGDHVVAWARPKGRRHTHLSQYLVLRKVHAQEARPGFRTVSLIVVTTILPPEELRRADIGEIYRRRWPIEVCFDDIKTTMCMEKLRTKTREMACRELPVHMIAYNLVRAFVARLTRPRHKMKEIQHRRQYKKPVSVSAIQP